MIPIVFCEFSFGSFQRKNLMLLCNKMKLINFCFVSFPLALLVLCVSCLPDVCTHPCSHKHIKFSLLWSFLLLFQEISFIKKLYYYSLKILILSTSFSCLSLHSVISLSVSFTVFNCERKSYQQNANYQGGKKLLIIQHNVASFFTIFKHCITSQDIGRWSGDPYQQHPFEMNKFPFHVSAVLCSGSGVHFSVRYELQNFE